MNYRLLLLLLVVVLSLANCEIAPAGQWTIEQAFNEGNLNDIEEYVAPDFNLHSPDILDGWHGTDGFADWVTTWRTLLPDLHITLLNSSGEAANYEQDLQVCETDCIRPQVLNAYNWRLTGTHSGTYLNIEPTRRHVVIEGSVVARYEDKQLVEVWLSYDSALLADLFNISIEEFTRPHPIVDLAGTDLHRVWLNDVNLSGANLSNTNFRDAWLGSVNLSDANLRNADLQGAAMEESNLSEADLSNANLQHVSVCSTHHSIPCKAADWTEINLSDANLHDAALGFINLADANLRRADLSNSWMEGANLSGANLWEANLNNAWLNSVNFEEANLRYADLRGANLQRASLAGAILDGAIFDKTTLLPDAVGSQSRYATYWTPDTDMTRYTNPQHPDYWWAPYAERNSDRLMQANLEGFNLRGAMLDNVDLSRAILRTANLNSASLSSANLSGSDLSSAELLSADLSGANLNGANLSYANLRRTFLKDANLTGANLINASLNGTFLKDANLANANLINADLRGANLQRANLIGVRLEGAIFDETTILPNARWLNPDYSSYWHSNVDMSVFTDPQNLHFWNPCVEEPIYIPPYCDVG